MLTLHVLCCMFTGLGNDIKVGANGPLTDEKVGLKEYSNEIRKFMQSSY